MPRRYQRTRNVSADIPVEAVYVGRPTKWGNPFLMDKHPRDVVVAEYRKWLHEPDQAEKLDSIGELTGKDLVCWCPLDQSCHADVLLELANPDE